MPTNDAKRAKYKAERSHPQAAAKNTYAMGFMLAVVGYCVLVFLPLTPARSMWWLLALVVIPMLTGITAAKGTSKTDSPAERFASGFWTCVIPMFAYVSIRLMVTHFKVGGSGNALAVLFVGALVGFLYALLAAVVAGLAGIVFYMQSNRSGGKA